MNHYALSELLIVLAGFWSARALLGAGRSAAALGVILLASAAAVGVVRFGLDRDGGLIAALADIHRLAGTLGGTAAMMALVYDMLARRFADTKWQGRYMLLASLALAFAMAFPKLAVPLFLLWSLGFIYLVAGAAAVLHHPPVQAVAIAAFMLVNVIVFRQAAWLSPAMSWHIFHILVALWLLGLGALLAKPAPKF